MRLQPLQLKSCLLLLLKRFLLPCPLAGLAVLHLALASASAEPLMESGAPPSHGLNNCGAIALHQLAVAIKGTNTDTSIIDSALVPANGFSLTELMTLSAASGLNLIAVQSPADGAVPVPSLVHWRRGHYSAIVEQRGDFFKVADPTIPTPWLSRDFIMAASSRQFLAQPAAVAASWQTMTRLQTDLIRGGSYPASPGYPDTNDTPQCSNSCSTCSSGMATWFVSEPYINLWLTDEPLGYNPGLGYRISFQLNFKQRETVAGANSALFSCGQKWDCSWISYVIAPSSNPAPGTIMTMIVAGGGERTYTADGATHEYYTRGTMSLATNTTGAFTGVNVAYPNGAGESYTFLFTNSPQGVLCFRTAETDPPGHSNQYLYTNSSGTIFLLGVVDTDGRTNTLSYTNTSFPNQITSVTDPFGRSASLFYNTNGLLTNITDVLKLPSAFAYGYGTNDWITNLTTPYGTTTFTLTDNKLTTNNAVDRAVLVVDPLGGTNLFASRYQSSFLVGTSYVVPSEPTGAPSFASTSMTNLNSWQWGPMQYPQLSTNNIYAFVPSDYLKGRQRNWLFGTNAVSFSDALNMEQAVSPNGLSPGLQIWRAYDGQTNALQGTNAQTAVAAWNLPDGNSSYQWTKRNVWGNPIAVLETWSQSFGGPSLTRTNQYFYYANGIDLQQQIGPLNETVAGFSYTNNHCVLTATNPVGYVTTSTYDGQYRLTSVTTPAGLTTTNIYFSSGAYTNWIQQRIDLQIHRTNSYFYANDLLSIQTNELGLVVSNTWDNLQRLTSTVYPDTTFISNFYANLDCIESVDRLGYPIKYAYDALRHLVAVTNALTNVTLFDYCSCGALESMRDALSNLTTISYDIAGRRVFIDYPDGSTVSNNYNPLGQVTNTIDGAGRSVTNWYTDHGLLYASSNAAGQLSAKSFDCEDRVTNSVNANGVVITNSYDLWRRMLVRGYSDGGQEQFGWSALGLVAYTNQLTNLTYYAYDNALRKTSVTNALTHVTHYAYDPAGDITNLTDANNHTTQWGYDLYARLTNKVDATGANILAYQYDANGRLTNRWSLAMSNTTYAYDAVGNLTNVSYHTSHSLQFSYDAMNQLITMADAIGTTTFTYTQTGQLASETGPWAGDTISYNYSDRLRTALSLQQPNASAWTQSYSYDTAYRMTNISSPAGSFSYAYNPGAGGTSTASSLISSITLPNGAYITNTYDNNGRMLGTWLTNNAGSNFDSSVCSYNVGNQRAQLTRTAENTATYTYDLIGQVVGDVSAEGSTNRLNEQLHYVFDPVGNLTYRTNNTLVENFQANSANELTSNTNGGKLTAIGATTSAATNVTVNGATAVRYGDATFAATNLALTTTYTAMAADALGRHSTNSVNVSLATNTSFQYDGNGNLTNDGLRNFTYNNENQLLQVWVPNQWFSQFAYDGKMRRRIRQEYTWQGGQWVQTNAVYYLYDRNLVIQERNLYNLPVITYTRGLDLAGYFEGASLPRQDTAPAGGIGGLLDMTLNFEPGPSSSNSMFYHSDVNGNVTALINPWQYLVAKYLYDAFGNVLSVAGSLAQQNLYRFSSREAHPNSGLVSYLYRCYDPHLQRWPTRDPLGEPGFEMVRDVLPPALRALALRTPEKPDLYSFLQNGPTCSIDPLGLAGWSDEECLNLLATISALCAAGISGEIDPTVAAEEATELKALYDKNCNGPSGPGAPSPSNKKVPCPIQVPIQPPPNSNNNTITPPNLWPYVPPSIIAIFLIPWPGNPVYGGL